MPPISFTKSYRNQERKIKKNKTIVNKRREQHTTETSSHQNSLHHWWWLTSPPLEGKPRNGAAYRVVHVPHPATNKLNDELEAKLFKINTIKGKKD